MEENQITLKMSELKNGKGLNKNTITILSNNVNNTYVTQSDSLYNICNYMSNDIEFTNDLTTTNPTIIDAINEISNANGIFCEDILKAGQNYIAFNNSRITNNSKVNWYSEIEPISVKIKNGQIEMNFYKINKDIKISVEIF